jgi:hypothetical protein
VDPVKLEESAVSLADLLFDVPLPKIRSQAKGAIRLFIQGDVIRTFELNHNPYCFELDGREQRDDTGFEWIIKAGYRLFFPASISKVKGHQNCCFASDMWNAKMKNNKKVARKLSLLIVAMGLAVNGCGKGQRSESGNSSAHTRTSIDPNPTGTWIEGDRNSVYNRLVVRPSGTFRFETVDFTGDVKGGYWGNWKAKGNSIRFEWGGIADSDSCSGRKIGRNSLVFGATTFNR